MNLSLRPYQEELAEHLLRTHSERDPVDRVSLGLHEAGLGKTVVAAASLARRPRLPGGEHRPAVVVCPSSVRAVWLAELARWAPDLHPVAPADTFGLRRPGPNEVLVIGHDQLGAMRPPRPPPRVSAPALAQHGKRLELHRRREEAQRSLADLLPGTDIVADEAHYLKGAAAARSLALEELWKRAARPRGGCLWLLSQAVDPCSPLDLWVVLDVAGIGERAFGGISECLERHFGGRYDRRARRWNFPSEPPGGSVLTGEVGARLGRYVSRRRQEDVLGELPAPRRVVTLCPVEGELAELGRRVLEAAELCAGYEPGSGLDVAPGEVLGALLGQKPRRTAPGRGHHGIDLGAVAELRSGIAAAKVPVVMRRLRELRARGIGVPGDPVVLCSEHLAAVDAVREYARINALREPWGFVTGGEDRDARARAVERLQSGELAGLAMTRAGQEGITLVRSRYMVKASLSWSAEDEAQRDRRLVRYGQEREVTIETIVADHPIERAVLRVLVDKRARGSATWGDAPAVTGSEED